MNVYLVVLGSGKRFYVESYQDYIKVFNRYYQRYGDELACVIKDFCHDSIQEVIQEIKSKKGVDKNG